MIYTVTFNPALDYYVHIDEFKFGEINRAVKSEVLFGGKGVNVSGVLKNLGVDNKALGFIAGFTGEAFENGLRSQGYKTDFIKLENGITRINVKLKSGEETEINGTGPIITPKALEQLFEKLEKLAAGDFLVLSGSIPPSVKPDIYEKVMARLEGRNIKIVVDASNNLLLSVLKYRPFLVKPNNHELGEAFGVKLKDRNEIIKYAEILRSRGAQNVLVSMAGDGAVLITDSGEIMTMKAAEGKTVNSVAAGDSMVAGFIAGYLKNGDYAEALRLGTACGGATAFSQGLCTKEFAEELYERLDSSLR